MEPIERGKGLTKSEIFLGALADRTFLDLWSYPNVFARPGKELCDLLVVCGDHVIIFSDKSIEWPNGDSEVAWPRWYKRAVRNSVEQIRGAERWLKLNPEEIYLDAKCTMRLPLELPPPERRIVHGICVAFGAEAACRSHCGGDDGSFFILPSLEGDQHIQFDLPGHLPFAIGDVDPTGPFVHVFDQASLTIVMHELDMITDFTRYLLQRGRLIRNKSLMFSPSEAEMVANYMLTMGADGHRFPSPRDFGADQESKIAFCEGEYEAFKTSSKYTAMRSQRRKSYIWDKLITAYTGPVLAGTSERILGSEPSVALSERALRFMAAETRMMRVAFGNGITEAITGFSALERDRFTRILFSRGASVNSDLAYIFMILAYPKTDPDVGYERYRRTRVTILETYCYAFLQDYPSYKRAVGIAINAPGDGGSSEDLIVIEAPEWSDEILKNLAERRAHFEILEIKNPKVRKVSIQEYPDTSTNAKSSGLNRHERRKASRRLVEKPYLPQR
jgi:hypothetical protein